jgi:hypothetical protein
MLCSLQRRFKKQQQQENKMQTTLDYQAWLGKVEKSTITNNKRPGEEVLVLCF